MVIAIRRYPITADTFNKATYFSLNAETNQTAEILLPPMQNRIVKAFYFRGFFMKLNIVGTSKIIEYSVLENKYFLLHSRTTKSPLISHTFSQIREPTDLAKPVLLGTVLLPS